MPRTAFNGQRMPALRKGGRRPKELEDDEDLSPEEERKRQRRRERNKVAAAKCRQRRLDTIASLSQQVEQLHQTQETLRSQIDQLQKEKAELEFLKQLHESVCKLRVVNVPPKHQNCVEIGRPTSLGFDITKDVLDVHTGLTPIFPTNDSMYDAHSDSGYLATAITFGDDENY